MDLVQNNSIGTVKSVRMYVPVLTVILIGDISEGTSAFTVSHVLLDIKTGLSFLRKSTFAVIFFKAA